MLSIFNTGGITLVLGFVVLTICSILYFQAAKKVNDPTDESYKKSVWKTPYLIMAYVVILAYILVIAFIVAPDYKGA